MEDAWGFSLQSGGCQHAHNDTYAFIHTCAHNACTLKCTYMYTHTQICWEGVRDCGRWGGSDEGAQSSPPVPVCGEDRGTPSPAEGGERGTCVYLVDPYSQSPNCDLYGGRYVLEYTSVVLHRWGLC